MHKVRYLVKGLPQVVTINIQPVTINSYYQKIKLFNAVSAKKYYGVHIKSFLKVI